VKPRRPLVPAALAVAAGAWLGATRPELAPAWAPAALVAGGAWIGGRRTARADGGAGGPALLLLVALAGWRAELAGRAGGAQTVGRFEAWYASGEASLGTLGGDLALEVDAGALVPGELVRILPGEAPVPPPRGPFPSSRARTVLPVRADQVRRLAPAPELLPRPWRAVRARLIERADALDPRAARGLARALVCGDAGGVDAALADLFVRTGLRHLLAVSGLHVGLMASLLALPLALLARSRPRARWVVWIGAALIALYVPLAGGAAPVRRAALAVVLAQLAVLVPHAPRANGARGRRADVLSLWSLALLLECAANARAPVQVGVQLSYLATLGLILGARRCGDALAGVLGIGRRRAPGRAGWPPSRARLLAGRIARALVTAVGASFAAGLITAPVVWHTFGECSPTGVPATPLVLPLVAWLLLAGWGVLAAPELVPAGLFELPALWLVSFLEVCDALPGTPWPSPRRHGAALAATAALTLAALARGGRWSRACALTWAGLLLPWSAAPAGLELVALDVGHGTAVALRAPGQPCWIFDAGSKDRPGVARTALAPLLAAWEVPRSAVVLAHDDSDHASALSWVVERYPPRLWAGALPAPLRVRLAHTPDALDPARGRLRLPLTQGPLELTVLRGLERPGNEGSRALEVVFDGRRTLLLGDAEEAGLAALLRSGALPGPCEVLLAPHHGSDCAWLGPLLERTRPAEVWISGALEPPIGRELDRRGLPWRWTARDGPLTFRVPWHGVRDVRLP
jgi:competence protein ComEC